MFRCTPCLFFFLMIPPPPRSTLFPYTTLFRSANLSIESEGTKIRHNIFTVDVSQHGLGVATEIALSPEQDRKSTRLNSSHRCISYAVFCLKKKTKKPKNKDRKRST